MNHMEMMMKEVPALLIRKANEHWPISVISEARRLFVVEGMTFEQTERQLGIPPHSCQRWSTKDGGWEKLRTKMKERAREEIRALAESPITPAMKLPETKTEVANGALSEIQAQIQMADEMMRGGNLTPDAFTKLVAAKATLWGLIHPKPGSLRPSRRRGATLSPDVSPEAPTT